MLTIAKCRAILEKNGGKYTDEEIQKIRDVLYKLAELFIKQRNEKNKGTKK